MPRAFSVVATASLSIHDCFADVEEGDVYIGAGLTATGLVAAPARVTVSELAGAERFHFLAMDGNSIIVRTPASTVLRPGEAVAIRLDPQHLHLFDGTGEDAAALR